MKKNAFLVIITIALISLSASAQDKNPAKTLRTMVTRAVDSFFLRNCIKDEVFSTNKINDPENNSKGYDVWQFKGFKWELRPILLTETERLNGFEFKGEIVINAKNFRQYHFCGENGAATGSKAACNVWQEWKSFESPVGIHLIKKNDEWTISAVDKKLWVYLPAGPGAPKCADIMKIK